MPGLSFLYKISWSCWKFLPARNLDWSLVNIRCFYYYICSVNNYKHYFSDATLSWHTYPTLWHLTYVKSINQIITSAASKWFLASKIISCLTCEHDLYGSSPWWYSNCFMKVVALTVDGRLFTVTKVLGFDAL